VLPIPFQVPPALRERRYAMYWTGLLVSMAGGQMQFWSLLWHISELTDQPIYVSGIGLVRFLSILIFSLFAGVIADTFDRRRIMFVTQTTMMGVSIALGLLTVSGQLTVWYIYLLTAIQAIAASFDLPARQALVPNLVSRENFSSAFSLGSIAANTGSIAGPAMSGLVISTLGLPWVYFINAATYLFLLLVLVLIGRVSQARGVPAGSPRVASLKSIAEGVRFILRQPIILSSMILDFFATFFSSANTLLPFVAQDILKVSVQEYGWLSAGQSLGAVSVALFLSQRANLRNQGKVLLAAVACFGTATILFGLSRSFLAALFSLVFVGASDSVSTILRNTIRQLQTPDHIRGRMVSINQIFFAGGPQLGEIEAGVVAQLFGIPAAIISGGIGCLVTVLGVTGIWPQLRRYRGDEPAAGKPAGG
jgi:MFS family permease